MNAIISLCHFCENHGPSILFCTQPFNSSNIDGDCASTPTEAPLGPLLGDSADKHGPEGACATDGTSSDSSLPSLASTSGCLPLDGPTEKDEPKFEAKCEVS